MYRNSPNYANFNCGAAANALPNMSNNRVYSLDGKATECGQAITTWQAKGHDVGTTVAPLPADDVVVQWAAQLLGVA